MAAVYPIRVAVISDVHANRAALEAVLADLSTNVRPQRVVGLGDFVFGGPEPARTLDLLIDACDLVLAGNTDPWIAGTITPGKTNRALCQWAAAQLAPAAREWLALLPAEVRSEALPGLLGVHATPRSDHETVLPDAPAEQFADAFGGTGAELIVCGHIHLPYLRRAGRTLVAGVGSVGFPADGDLRACYAVLEHDGQSWSVVHRRVAYDVDATIAAMRSSGMPEADERVRKLTGA